MATHYKAIVEVGKSKHQLILWSEKDVIEKSDSQVISDIMQALKELPEYLNKSVAFDLKKLIECDSKGVTTIYDEYRIIDQVGLVYGVLQKALGTTDWIYESPNLRHVEPVKTPFKGIEFQLYGNLTYKSQWFIKNLPKKAHIDWDRLEVHCEDQVLDLEVIAR